MTRRRARLIAAAVLALMSVASTSVLAAEAPAGQMTWALHFSLAPTLFEPAETPGLITPFMILYAPRLQGGPGRGHATGHAQAR